MVVTVGFGPTRPFGHNILSVAGLPIPPRDHKLFPSYHISDQENKGPTDQIEKHDSNAIGNKLVAVKGVEPLYLSATEFEPAAYTFPPHRHKLLDQTLFSVTMCSLRRKHFGLFYCSTVIF